MRSYIHARTCAALVTLTLLFLAAGCSPLPPLENRQASHALSLQEAQATPMGRTISHMADAHPERSGIYTLANPHEAFAVRALLAGAAQRTIDVQYYIWRNDLTGTLLMESLRKAADRGVRVRVLLDDSGTASFDSTLAALDFHPNIEVRLFNPMIIRFPRWTNYFFDFKRVNRRMHNKSFTADNQATIIGGRNVGDEYFGATDGILFADLDVLAVGPVVQEVSTDFDRYWNSQSAYPVSLLLPAADAEQLDSLVETKATGIAASPAAQGFVTAMEKTDLVHKLVSGDIDLEWAPTRMLSDDPRKALGNVPKETLVAYDLNRYFGSPKSNLELVSSYFVPTKAGVRHLTGLAHNGVSVSVLTNSLAATDVAAVHAGYAKRRATLLKAGVKLYEMRPHDDQHQSPVRISGSRGGRFGSSGSSLHAKTLSIDDQRLFVGSFNFDPRSAKLNTELGFVIESAKLSQEIHNEFMKQVPDTAYEVHLSDDGNLYWTELRNGKVIRYDAEPESGFWRRALVGFLSVLPIEWLL